jgi:outer membrane protein assembly factor BamB
MKMSKNKIAIVFALFLMFAMAFSLVALPAANAHTPAWNIKTYAFISVEPDPVGVGQQAYVNFWIDKAPPTASGAYGDRWHDFKVTVTDPSGDKETLGPFTSDDTGGAHTTYTPDTIGNYTFVFNFPGETIEGANPAPGVPPFGGTYQPQYVGDYYEGSTSSVATLVAQEESVPYYPSTPLPTGYWQRPIYSENLDWYQIGGNWLGLAAVGFTRITGQYNASGNFNPYTTAPNSAHILWTKPLAPGGIIGGEFGGDEYGSSYMQTPQYEPKFGGIIINGVLYYQELPGSSTYPAGWVAVDMRTGQEIWTKNTDVPLLCGEVLKYVSPNQFGGLSYLWSTENTVRPNTGTTYGMYDAMTGNWILNIVNGTGITKVEGDDGTLLGYYTNSTDHTLNLWNSTRAIIRGTGSGDLNSWTWRPPQGEDIPFSYGIQWSAPIATEISGETISPNLGVAGIDSGVVVLSASPGTFFQEGWIVRAGYSATDGHLLWGPKNYTYIPGDRISTRPYADGMWFEFNHPTETWTAWDLKTGAQVWGPTEAYPNPWGYFVAYPPIAAYGRLYACDFGGYVHAYDLKTGETLWSFFSGESGYETPYGTYPLWHIEAVADGKVFVAGGHDYSPPLFRGAQLYCLNASTGELMWSISSFCDSNSASAAIADGILLKPNGYDNQLYAYGKGLSATTVSAPDTVQPLGTQILVQGTVTDQSPGQTCLGVPAAGTPAIADEYMSPWMEYLYMQQPKPTNATGVKVTITVLDPNNNCYDVGTTTSDIDGFFKLTFTPQVPGAYNVYATFTGSESYYGSSALTAINVVEAPSATAPPTPQPASLADIYFLPMSIVLLIAIIVVGIAMVLMFRRR